MRFKNWRFSEGGQDIVYENKSNNLIVMFGQFSRSSEMPYSSRVGYFELIRRRDNVSHRIFEKRFNNRKEAKEYAFWYMKEFYPPDFMLTGHEGSSDIYADKKGRTWIYKGNTPDEYMNPDYWVIPKW